MAVKTPFFWEDATQAQERLGGSFVLWGDKPAFIDEVIPVEQRGDVPYARVTLWPDGKQAKLSLSDEGFSRFRKLPPTGWINYDKHSTALFLERRPVRSRQHGLSSNNVSCGKAGAGEEGYSLIWRDYTYETVARDKSYAEACVGDFPGLNDILQCIREGSSIACSSKYAVVRDVLGLRWLFRNSERVGVFPDTDTLLLVGKHSYLREEIADDTAISVSTIKEF